MVRRVLSDSIWEQLQVTMKMKGCHRYGYSPTEVMYAFTSMRVELGMAKSELLANLAGEQQLKFIWPPMRMEIRSILKSLEV